MSQVISVVEQTTPEEDALIAKRLKRQKGRRLIFRLICVTAGVIILLWGMTPFGFFAINGVYSIEGRFFFVKKHVAPERGELAAFHPPDGNLYPDAMWFAKYVKGVPGDVITTQDRNIYINGEFLGEAKLRSSSGFTLDMINAGTIPPGQYFFWTPHPHSYDSRYSDIGLIHESQIIGRPYRIF